MKILLVNKFYYNRGGDCVYMQALERILHERGHETAVFAMQHPKNTPTPWCRYFPTEIEFSSKEQIMKTLRRPFGGPEVIEKANALMDDFRPDVVHLNNIHSYLSPIIGELAHKRGIRVVWTLHDYKLLCPRYDCMRNGKELCEKCFTDKRNVLRYRCMKDSLTASILAYIETMAWNRKRIEAFTDVFICPSLFMAEKMAQGGFDRRKLRVLPNFINTEKCRQKRGSKGNYYCYCGRLSHEKGLRTLIEAANALPYRLIVVGDGPLAQNLKQIAASHVVFAGFRTWNEIAEIAGKARFTVLPSEWYENCPLSVIESLCLGTPVLGARIGGIPELVREKENGLLFESRNIADLRNKIQEMYKRVFDCDSIATDAQSRHSADTYYKSLMKNYKPIS